MNLYLRPGVGDTVIESPWDVGSGDRFVSGSGLEETLEFRMTAVSVDYSESLVVRTEPSDLQSRPRRKHRTH